MKAALYLAIGHAVSWALIVTGVVVIVITVAR